jgi:hypothetical protein
MSTKAERAADAAEARAEARAEEAATRKAEDKAAAEEQSTDVSAVGVLGTAQGQRREGTTSRIGMNGFTEILNETGDVIERIDPGAPKAE